MSLTDTLIRQTKPQQKAIKLFDGRGLFLLVTPTGSRCWRLKYRFQGREKLLALGLRLRLRASVALLDLDATVQPQPPAPKYA